MNTLPQHTNPVNTNPVNTNPVNTNPVWIGLDVSKDTLDACLLRSNGKHTHKQFDNTPAGHQKLLRWVEHLAPDTTRHFCLEATGSYSQPIALFLAAAEQAVSLVNPARIRFFALSQAQGNKTDKPMLR